MRARERSAKHIGFMVTVYSEQMDGGRYFLHEHPLNATSWHLDCMEKLMSADGVERVHGDQCQFGATAARGPRRGGPVKKPTGFLSNSPAIRRALSLRCTGSDGTCSRPGGGRHVTAEGVVAKDAARYPRSLCRAMLRGVAEQLKEDSLVKSGCFGVQVPDDDTKVENELKNQSQGYSGRFRDDLSGQLLKDDLVHKARAVELAFFYGKAFGQRCLAAWQGQAPGDRQSPCVGLTSTRATTSTRTTAHASSPESSRL